MRRRTGEVAAAALVLALLAAPLAAAARTAITATVDRTELAKDEVLVLTVRIDADDPASLDLREGELPFRILSRSWSTDVSFGLGGGGGVQFRRSRVLTLTLSAKRTGTLVIPPIVATVKGARHATEPIRVKVLPAGKGPRPAPQPPERSGGGSWRGWERDLVLEVDVDRREVFLGEQVVATVSLLSPLGLVAIDAYAPPLYDGFWMEELERARQPLRFELRTVNGVPMRAYAIQRLALFPTRAGQLEIGAFEVDAIVRLGDSLFADARRARRRSAPVAVRVKPLPAGAPSGFQAVNVGTYRLEASASAPTVPAGEPVAIRITASGDGNVRAVSLPSVPSPPGARSFEPTWSDQLAPEGGRLRGSRTVETAIVADSPGELVVPALSWPFFDPRSGAYAIARTEELRVRVVPGAASAPEGPAGPLLRPLRVDAALGPRSPPPWTRPPFLATVVIPPALFLALVLADAVRRRSARGASARRYRAAGRVAAKRLRGARRILEQGDARAALDDAGGALAAYAADRLGRSVSGLTREALVAALGAAGAAPASCAALAAALDACDASRFGGAGSPEHALADAERAIAALEAARWPARQELR
jgi:hypothetical protein